MKLTLDREHAPTTIAMVLAILMMAGALVLMLLPKPNVDKIKQQLKNSTFNEQLIEKNALADSARLKAQIATQTWSGSASQLASAVPIQVAKLAAKHNVQVVSLRPQRTTNGGDLTQIGYLVNVTGPFGDVLAFESDLDKPDSRLAVENLQLGASDETTDNVNGTIGIDAYMLTPAPVTTTTKKTTNKVGPKAPAISPKSKVPASGGPNVKA